MTIQFNTDHHFHFSAEHRAPFIELIKEELGRFSDQITRVEVHLSDEDSSKNSKNDIKCLMEARMAGREPVVVSNLANSKHEAIEGAIEKLKNSLDSIVGRMNDQRQYTAAIEIPED